MAFDRDGAVAAGNAHLAARFEADGKTEGAEVIGSAADVANAAYRFKGEQTYAVQFHPEVFHSEEGPKILENFVKGICGCRGDWTPENFIDTTVASLREQIGGDHVILGLSGGVDSTVAAVLP